MQTLTRDSTFNTQFLSRFREHNSNHVVSFQSGADGMNIGKILIVQGVLPGKEVVHAMLQRNLKSAKKVVYITVSFETITLLENPGRQLHTTTYSIKTRHDASQTERNKAKHRLVSLAALCCGGEKGIYDWNHQFASSSRSEYNLSQRALS